MGMYRLFYSDPCTADDYGTCPIHDLVGATDDAETFSGIAEELKTR